MTGRGRILVGIPIAYVILFVFHQAFPKLTLGDRLMYSAMECVPLALVFAFATQNELRRRAERERKLAAWQAANPGQDPADHA